MLLCVLGWVAVAWLPGWAVLAALRFGRRLDRLAVAPLATMGLVTVAAGLCDRLGIPFDPWVLGLTAIPIAVLARRAVARRSARRSARSERRRARSGWRWAKDHPTTTLAWLLLAVAIVTTTAVWLEAHSSLRVPAGWDSVHHGYFARRITDLATVDPRRVLATDTISGAPSGSFYPLAGDELGALLHQLLGRDLGQVFLAMTTTFAGVGLPTGLFALVRRIDPDRPLVAGLAAGAAAFQTALVEVEYSGRLTAVVGVALLPSALLGILLVIAPRARRRLLGIGALVVLGAANLHTSEIPLLALGALALAAGIGVQRRSRAAAGQAVVRLGVVLAVAAVAALALVPGITTIVSQRATSYPAVVPQSWSAAGRSAVLGILGLDTPGQLFFVLAALLVPIGLAAALFRLRFLPLAVTLVAVAGIAAVAFRGSGALHDLLTTPWYRDPPRVLWEASALLPIFQGLGAATLVGGGARLVRALVLPRVAVAGALCVTIAGVAVLGFHQGRIQSRLVGVALASLSPVRDDNLAAFRFLAARTSGHERVWDDLRQDAALWMYVVDGVNPLFANSPFLDAVPRSWTEKLALRHLDRLGQDPELDALLVRYRVRYAYYGDEVIPDGGAHTFALEALRANPRACEVFDRGTAHVFRILPAGSTRQCAGVVS